MKFNELLTDLDEKKEQLTEAVSETEFLEEDASFLTWFQESDYMDDIVNSPDLVTQLDFTDAVISEYESEERTEISKEEKEFLKEKLSEHVASIRIEADNEFFSDVLAECGYDITLSMTDDAMVVLLFSDDEWNTEENKELCVYPIEEYLSKDTAILCSDVKDIIRGDETLLDIVKDQLEEYLSASLEEFDADIDIGMELLNGQDVEYAFFDKDVD